MVSLGTSWHGTTWLGYELTGNRNNDQILDNDQTIDARQTRSTTNADTRSVCGSVITLAVLVLVVDSANLRVATFS